MTIGAALPLLHYLRREVIGHETAGETGVPDVDR